MKIFKDDEVLNQWVCLTDCYMYNADTLIKLLLLMLREWKNDEHLVG